MKRIFPTQLKVVSDRSSLIDAEEAKKGYYDSNSKNSIRIGVQGNQFLYLSSPGNWYRSYIFELLKIPSEPDDEADVDENTSYDGWRLVAQLVKTECGRKVIHHPGENFVTLAGINKDMAKQFYYLTKHTLTKLGVEFKVTHSLMSSPMHLATPPDIREKPKRKRKKTISKTSESEKLTPNPYYSHGSWAQVVACGAGPLQIND